MGRDMMYGTRGITNQTDSFLQLFFEEKRIPSRRMACASLSFAAFNRNVAVRKGVRIHWYSQITREGMIRSDRRRSPGIVSMRYGSEGSSAGAKSSDNSRSA